MPVPSGPEHKNAKLSAAQVKRIREMGREICPCCKRRRWTATEIAEHYPVSHVTIHKIITDQSYRNLL